MSKIVKLTPYLSYKVWGGSKLSQIKNIETDTPLGESWDVSTLEEGSSFIGESKLSDLCSLSYLIKFIDTSAHLSIQVHPDNEYAKEFENTSGKTECWIIMDSEPGAGIYLGFKDGVTKKEFFNGIENGLSADSFLNFIPVQKGDFFYIPAGAIHAIGSGVTLCEVQQSSGVTYRIWDWNRMGLDGKPRELHLEKAKDVTNFSSSFNQKIETYFQKNLFNGDKLESIIEHNDFKVQLFSYTSEKEIALTLENKNSIVLLEGELKGDIELKPMDAAFVLEGGSFDFKLGPNSSFLVVTE